MRRNSEPDDDERVSSSETPMIDETRDFLPDSPPAIPHELVEKCKQTGDFRPILFERYKYVFVLCNRAACLAADSPAFRSIPPVHYAVLTGLLNRCSRLMLANTRLSCTLRYGETTRLLDRSISESAVKVMWLCHKGDSESFHRYLTDGLKKDLLLKAQIEDNIRNRGGKTLPSEKRMLASIAKASGLQLHVQMNGIRNAFPCKCLRFE